MYLHFISYLAFCSTEDQMEQPYMLPILCRQYHSCWCPDDFSRQCISRHGIDQMNQNIPFLASEELINGLSDLGYSVYITLTSCPQNSKLANGRYTYSPHKQFFHCTPNSMEFHFALIQVAVEGSLQNLAHDMIAMLLWHVQNFVVIWWHVMEAQWEKFPLNLNNDWKINNEVSPALFEWYINPLKPG